MSRYGTKYPETEALLAASQFDYALLTEILDGMLPTEIAELYGAADRLRVAALAAMRAQTPLRIAQEADASTAPLGA